MIFAIFSVKPTVVECTHHWGHPTAWASEDRVLRARARHDLGYRANILDDIARGPVGDGLYVLRRPRRVGKSVVLKDLVVQLCQRNDVDPRRVIYLAADQFSARDLRRAVVLGAELSRAGDSQPRVWLFDEVTGVAGWTTEIKALRDGTRFGDDTVILTGSSMTGAEQAVRDLGAGRAGESNVSPFRTLLPMTFRSVLEATAKELAVIDLVPPSRLQSDDVASRLDPIVDELDLAWQRYVESGGLPRAVAEYHRDGAVTPAFMESLASWLTADVEPAAPPDSVALLITELHDRCAAPLNVRGTASALGYSRDQMNARLSPLVRSYAGIWCQQVDRRGRRIANAQGKFYLTDPVLNWLGHRLRPGVTQPDFTRLTEAGIGIALARAIAAGRPDRWSAGDTIGYSKTDSRKEIDFAPVAVATAGGQEMTPAIEAKWVTDGWRSEARAIEGNTAAAFSRPRTSSTSTIPHGRCPHPSWPSCWGSPMSELEPHAVGDECDELTLRHAIAAK